jgi:hypothetical protein
MKKNTAAIVLVFFSFILTPCLCLAWEAKFQQKAELFIVDGKVEKSEPHAYVTLDIQKDKVIYGEIEDWVKKTKEYSGGIFYIVSQGPTFMTSSRSTLIDRFKDYFKRNIRAEGLDTQYVIRAVYYGGESVNFLIIAESFLLEVKNSVFFGNAINYMFYERIR